MIRLSPKYLLFILLIFSSYTLFSQGRYGNQLPQNSISTLTSKSEKLYYGIDNYISIDTTQLTECQTYFLTINSGTIVHDTNNIFLILPKRPGKLRLNLHCVNDLDTILLGYKFFNIHNTPNPQLTLNNKPITTPTTLEKGVLLNCDSLGVYFSDDIEGSENWLTITEFQLGYNYGGFHVSHLNKTNKLSSETFKLLNNLGPDHEISLRATVESPGKVKKELPIYRIRFY